MLITLSVLLQMGSMRNRWWILVKWWTATAVFKNTATAVFWKLTTDPSLTGIIWQESILTEESILAVARDKSSLVYGLSELGRENLGKCLANSTDLATLFVYAVISNNLISELTFSWEYIKTSGTYLYLKSFVLMVSHRYYDL